MVSSKLKDILQPVLGEEELSLLVRGYDVIGDVAIIIIPEALEYRESQIAEALLDTVKSVRVVAKRVGCYSGEYRTIRLKKIAGSGDLETLHKEFGVRLHVHPEKVYFSPRSGTERYRIAKQISSGERVLVMFSGIAPLPLMIALNSDAREIVGIEKNPDAHRYGLKNLKANPRVKNVMLLEGDVKHILPQLHGCFDRIAMPLPRSGAFYLPQALEMSSENCWLHFYDFQYEGEFMHSEEVVRDACREAERSIAALEVVRCGHISPGKYRVCVDALIK